MSRTRQLALRLPAMIRASLPSIRAFRCRVVLSCAHCSWHWQRYDTLRSIDFNYRNHLLDSFIFMKKIAQARRLLIVFRCRSKTQRQGDRPSSRPPAPRKWFGERHKIVGTEAMPYGEQIRAGTPIPDEACGPRAETATASQEAGNHSVSQPRPT